MQKLFLPVCDNALGALVHGLCKPILVIPTMRDLKSYVALVVVIEQCEKCE
jgi:hypothetical protein